MSSFATISIDRRAAYYERCAKLIAADPLGFYARAEAGRRIQSAIRPKDLQPFSAPVPAPAPVEPSVPASVFNLALARAARR